MPASKRRTGGASVSIGRIAGIPIRLHFTFLLFLAWVVVSHLVRGHGWPAAAGGLLLLVAVFAIIVIHELAHALVARHFGIRTKDILLLPIGGVGRIERIPERPGQELAISLAGPLVNVVLALVLWGILAIMGRPVGPPTADVGASMLVRLLWLNVILAVFNLLPAFPMDGGRVLRAALAFKLDRARATAVAARIGKIFAVVFGLLGLYANPLLIFIAIFVWIGAAAESSAVQVGATLSGVPIARVMLTEFDALTPDDKLVVAAQRSMSGFQREFPVLDGDRPVGVLSRSRLVRGLSTYGPDARVEKAMNRDFRSIERGETADHVGQGADDEPILVMDGPQLAGLVLPEHLTELFVLLRRSPA